MEEQDIKEAPTAPEAMPSNPETPQEIKGIGVKVKKCAIWFKNAELKTKFKEARKAQKMKAEPFLELLLKQHAEAKQEAKNEEASLEAKEDPTQDA